MTALAQHAETIARALLGEPNKHLSTRHQLRFGNHGSLAVEIQGKKAGTWFDHESGEGGGVLALIVRHRSGTRRDALEWIKSIGIDFDSSNGAAGPPHGRVAEYVYHDRAGEPLYRVVRSHPKAFTQERFDSATGKFVGGNGCMADVQRVPYRLNEWLDEDGPILIAEGERKVDALFELSFLATCNSGGARKFSRGFAPYFQDRDVVLLPDNDDAGRDHVRQVAAILEPVASSIRIVELPGVGEKGDVLDWLRAGGTCEELRSLIECAALYIPPRNTATAQHPPEPEPEDEFIREARRLAQLPPHEYDRVRKAEANRLSVRTATLDAAIDDLRKARQAGNSIGKGQALVLPEPELWHEPVDGAELIADLVEQIMRYVVLADHASLAAAIWCLHAHALAAAFHSPRLTATSPTMRCGKSTLLRTISRLVPRPLPTANITPAAMFRVIEACKPTLLIDEADSFAHENEELRGVINSSHCRLDAFVIRAVPAGDYYEARQFSTWAAMAIASIGKVASTIADRSIMIPMERKAPGQKVERMRVDRDDGFGVLASKAARWVADHLEELRQADPDVPRALNDRQADNWRLMLAIADLVGGHWPEQARTAALALSTADEDADTLGVQLLASVHAVFGSIKTETIWTEDLLHHLYAMSEAPWGEYGRQRKPITARQLGALLKPFGIVAGQVWKEETNKRGYTSEEFSQVWRRYLSASPLEATETARFINFPSARNDQPLADGNPPKAAETASSSTLADSDPLSSEETEQLTLDDLDYRAGDDDGWAEFDKWIGP